VLSGIWVEVVALVAAFAIAVITTLAGVSGAVLLLPFQVSVLGTPSPSVTPTNLLYNVVASPGAIWRYRHGQTGGALTLVLVAGTLPGIVAGSVIRVYLLPGPVVFDFVVAAVLIPLGGLLALTQAAPASSARPARLPRVVIGFIAAVAGCVGGIYGIGGGSILQRAGHDRTTAFQRGAQGVQLLPREPQLHAEVVDAGGPGLSKMIKQPPPAGIGRAHAGDLGPANGIQQVSHLTRDEQVLAPVHAREEIATLGQFAEPRPLGRGPRGKTWAARLVRVLMTGPIQARQRAIGGAGQQPAIAQELLRLSERAQRPVRSQPAVKRPPLQQLPKRLHGGNPSRAQR
jgi:hypothetical protein